MFHKILVPLDGSELASRILPQVAELAKRFNSEVTLLHVCPSGQAAAASSGKALEGPSPLKVCEAYLSLLAKEFQRQGLQVRWACLQGVASREIIRYAHEQKMDLIAMATHGRGEVAWLLGSTAEKVVTHATVPVMLFRIFLKEIPPLKEERKLFI